jgi:hypothetical protein
MRTSVLTTVAAIASIAGGSADAASNCRDVARHMESGSVALTDEPVQIVPERRGRCVLILSGWAIEADAESIFGSGSVNIGDANVTADGATGGFVPPTPDPLEIQTEDEVWAVTRESHPNGVITWIELFD